MNTKDQERLERASDKVRTELIVELHALDKYGPERIEDWPVYQRVMEYVNLQVAAKLCEFYDAGSLAVQAAESLATYHAEKAESLRKRKHGETHHEA